MEVDLAKLFPTGFESLHINEFRVETKDITHFYRDTTCTPQTDNIVVNNKTYSFEAKDKGFIILVNIGFSEKILELYEKNKSHISGKNDFVEKLVESSKQCLAQYKSEYS